MTKAREGWVREGNRWVYIPRGAPPKEPAMAVRTYSDRPRDVRSRSACARARVGSAGLSKVSFLQDTSRVFVFEMLACTSSSIKSACVPELILEARLMPAIKWTS